MTGQCGTVDSLLTHTPLSHLRVMGYKGVWVHQQVYKSLGHFWSLYGSSASWQVKKLYQNLKLKMSMIKTHYNDGLCKCSQSMCNTHPMNQKNATHLKQMMSQIQEEDEQI